MKRLVNVSGITKIYYNSEWEEYSVVVVGLTDDSTYFTDDREDAFDTANYINNHRNKYGFDCRMTVQYPTSMVTSRKFFRDKQDAEEVAAWMQKQNQEIINIKFKQL